MKFNNAGWPQIGRFIGTTHDLKKDRWPWQKRRVYNDELDVLNECKYRWKVKLYEHKEITEEIE